jgi:phytoene desaturase
MKKVAIIGGGFAGLSSACYLAKAGYDVSIFEKNSTVGGRNRKFSENGYTFEMGPSWYWMPDVFDKFFADFGKNREDYYSLTKLNPSFSIVFDNKEKVDIPAEEKELIEFFENIEKGAGNKLQEFMSDAKYKYDTSMDKLIYKPGKSIVEFIELDVIKGVFKLNLFSNFKKFVRKYFKDKKLTALMDFPVLFLGSAPEDTPALYSLMNYAGLLLGTWYPKNGMYRIIESMEELAKELGVKIHTNAEISNINTNNKSVTSITLDGNEIMFDGVIGAGDYHHMESLLPVNKRNYTENYWENRTLAPSSLIFFLGVNKKLEGLDHHTLFFDESLDDHSKEIYKDPKWPEKPLFYICNPSKTDSSLAPEGHENIFVLIPIAPNLEDTEEVREKYYNIIMDRMEKQLNQNVKDHVDYKKSYCIKDFKDDYHSYKGNAYGLANTLTQTAFLKPKLNNKKLNNLVYSGQLTVPGPGMPPSLISGKLAAEEIIKQLKI